MRLAIIIPVYNVRDTLDRCVHSIVSQSYTDWELILVDDGSTDGSGRQCDRWAMSDSRIRCIHQPNGGLSAARNTGINACWQQAEYITFADSDDYVEQGTLSVLMEKLGVHPDYDILEYPVSAFEGGEKEHMIIFTEQTFTDMSQYWLNAYQHSYAWNKIYRATLFSKVRFPEGLIFEDAWTLPSLLQNSHCVATTNEGLYHYISNPQGITSQANGSPDKSEILLKAQLKALETLGIDLMANKKDVQQLYLSLLNIQITINRLHGSWLLPWRWVSHSVGESLIEQVKILLNNLRLARYL